MEVPTTYHDYRPTHNPTPAQIVEAEENAAWAWKALDDLIEERDPLLTHLEPEWWERHAQLYKAACEAEDRLRQLRDAHLNGKHDPSDPPTQEQLYEITHNMTEEFIELSAHPRNCRCPLCEGEPEDWEDIRSCTCDPDPNREGATCPACREVLAEMAESELPY